MSKPWPRVKLGDVLIRSDETAQPDIDAEYKEITIRLWGKGVIERGRVSGASVNGRRFIARKDQFIASRIDARNGAMGIVPGDLDGALVTNDFPLFDVNHDRLLSQYMGWLCRTPAFVDLCARASEGTTNRVRLKESEFLNLEIEIPGVEDQRRIVARIDAVQQRLQQADTLRSSIDHDIASLLAVRFQETLKHAEWRPMREVAPLVRREVTIHPEKKYSELGIRSFFKGAFARRTISGTEFTWQKLYEIKSGDLIFSNIMAWEKGIALAEPVHDGCVGNHRMLTCEAKAGRLHPAYLNYYFTTEEGFSKIYAASPGTAARNRTLTADSLMDIVVPCPAINQQNAFSLLRQKLRDVTIYRGDSQIENEALLKSLIQNVLALVN